MSRSGTDTDTVLVTGGTGFVGSAIVRKLQESGFTVRVLARASSPRANVQGLGVEVVEGDLLVRGSLDPAVRGCRFVFHAAADYRLWTPDVRHLRATNVDGTRSIMEAALEAGVERVVYTGSVATLGNAVDGLPVRCIGDDQFVPPSADTTNYKPTVVPDARELPTFKRHSLYLRKTTQTQEEHYVCLLMPTASGDSEPDPSRAWVTDVAQPNWYGITLGTETFLIHRTADAASFQTPDTGPPAEVSMLTATARDKAIEVQWTDPTDADLKEIQVWIRTAAIP